MTSHVFARAVAERVEPFTLPNSEDVIELTRGDVILLPYEPIRNLLLEGSLVLT